MRFVKNITMIAVILISVALFLFTCRFYDFYHDDFTFFDLNFVSEEIKEEDKEVIAKPEGDTSAVFPDISFSTVFDSTYRYYQIVGWFLFLALLASINIMFLICLKFSKIEFYEFFKDVDNIVIFFMSSVLLSYIIMFVDVKIYNTYFLNDLGAESFKTVDTTATIDLNS